MGVIVAAWAVSAGTALPAAADTDPRGYLTKMKAREMWKVADGSGVTVAVIDSGVKDVPGLEGRVLPGVSFMEPPFEHPDQPYPPHEDFVGHGTTMTAAIVGDGSAGGPQGLAPGAKVLPIRTSIGTPMAFAVGGEMAKGLRYAADHGAKIISLSLGVWEGPDMKLVRPAVEYAQSKGVLIFAAMGNEAEEAHNLNNPIAALPGVIGVGAVDDDAAPMGFSSYGPDTDVSSIGNTVVKRCTNNTGWCEGDGGTSYATALASASAALIWSAHPDWTANQVARVLIETAGAPVDGSKRTDKIGYGVVRPRKVLLDHEGNPGAPDTDPLASPAPVKAPAPSAAQTAAEPRRAESAEAESGTIPWKWPALGAVAALSVGLGITVLVKRRRR
ncbi:type VII secretion-associated serine protease [Streptomyces lavendulae subsp. lavendulae]|uniref:S8 family serine peptidase n=1 Tax=Streptomyces lavendulae TaxID=1914 RepID=UPI0024A14A8B|nr:S8 family serine peptidase [Streptomyces lavendulae]GLV87869.1 type VII secretion-associated serine protease [Streptomyces lavendulae subsp. lavendulae]